MQQSATDPSTGQIDMDCIQIGVSSTDRRARDQLSHEVLVLLKRKQSTQINLYGLHSACNIDTFCTVQDPDKCTLQIVQVPISRQYHLVPIKMSDLLMNLLVKCRCPYIFDNYGGGPTNKCPG